LLELSRAETAAGMPERGAERSLADPDTPSRRFIE
jgi:hypothetical protein